MDKLNTIKLFFYEKKKYIIALSIVLLMLLISSFYLLIHHEKVEEIVTFSDTLEEKNELKEEGVMEKEDELEYYYVDVKGYVNSPGVYSLLKGKRVVDAINQAGGLRENADTSLLNLSREISDEMVIIVYSKEEMNSYGEKEKEGSKAEICLSEPVNDACTIVPPKEDNDDEIIAEGNIILGENKEEKEDKEEVNQSKININEASIEELMTLSKIGESKALAIIEYRETNGCFKTVEEIKNVSGIGEALFNTIKDNITV